MWLIHRAGLATLAIIAITSYDCAIRQMAILHDAMKTIHNGVFVLFFFKTKTCFIKQMDLKNPGGLFFFKKRVFLNPDYLSNFLEIFP